MCGDATCEADVAALMEGEKAGLYLTDPPYNVNYEGRAGKIMNDSMEGSAFKQFLTDAFTTATTAMRPGAGFYIWHADGEGRNFREAAEAAGLHVRQCLIWVKNQLVLGRQDYQWRHEPCLYGWTEGKHYFTPDRTQTTVQGDEKPNYKRMKKEELVEILEQMEEQTPQTVIHEDKPAANAEHPTMKPIKLLARLIRNSTIPGEIVLDTFGGSGSTLIAAHQLNRRCFTMELDPKYVDVIVDRYEKLTGEKAQKLSHNVAR